MGMFFLIRGEPPAGAKAQAAARVCAEMGFLQPTILQDDIATLFIYPKRGQERANVVSLPNGDFVAACGTFLFRQKMGEVALRTFYEAFDGNFSLLEDSLCAFALIIKKHGRIFITSDPAGLHHVFRDSNNEIASSSYLVTSSSIEHPTVAKQSVFEYVFQGVVSGNATLLTEVSVLPIGASLVFERGAANLNAPRLAPPVEPWTTSRADLLDRGMAELDAYFRAINLLFQNRITCALSGGFDSRLILAMLRRCGCDPRVYVYGDHNDQDVVLASAMARGEGFRLKILDKGTARIVAVEQFPALVAHNYLWNDGYLHGGIFHGTTEEAERADRTAGGAIGLNGGGGEIFRNFFYLPDGSYSPRQILWSFYSRFDPRICTDRFDTERYYEELERKMLDVTGPMKRFPRPTVEWLYHRFRCRSWDGRTNTVNSQYGFTALPYLQPRITAFAARIPIRWKNHGAFEAELIRTADPRLASYPSTRQHSLAAPPTMKARIGDFTTLLRPTWLRRFSYRAKRPWMKLETGPYLARPYVEAALPEGVEAMRAYFELDRVSDADHMARILTLEYLIRRLGSGVRLET